MNVAAKTAGNYKTLCWLSRLAWFREDKSSMYSVISYPACSKNDLHNAKINEQKAGLKARAVEWEKMEKSVQPTKMTSFIWLITLPLRNGNP